jgi:hypothetical protein
MTTFQATIPGVIYHGAELEPGAEIVVETLDDMAEIEAMFQRGALVVVNPEHEGAHHRGRRTPPMTTETGPNPATPPAKPAEGEERPHRTPGARPEGYGRRDMKPTGK